MPKKLTTEEFIIKAKEKHTSFYLYSKVVYKSSSDYIVITCPIHGDFQQRPNNHLNGRGCNICSLSKVREPKSIEQFLKEAEEKHSGKYKYNKVILKKARDKVIITCPIHGDFKQSISSHLQGCGCYKCGVETSIKTHTHSEEQFVEKAKEVHKNLYTYTNTNYTNSNKKVNISCILHGRFEQRPADHLRGHGCPKCATDSKAGYTRTEWLKKAKGRICIFYILRCFDEKEEFYKIGRTMNSVKTRYKDSTRMPYKYEVVSEVKGEAGYIWDLELQEKRELKESHYSPTIRFSGSATECFTQYKKIK